MARDIPTGGTEYHKVTRRTKLNGKRRSLDAAKKRAAGPGTVVLQEALGLQKLPRALIEGRQQVKSAQHQIEILVEHIARFQQEFIELVQKEAQARYLAYHDGLTGLPNRSLLQDRFHQAMSQAKRQHKPLALILLDLDEFKCVNDKLGHASGDKLLQAVAVRLTAAIRGADTACRYGGDEFAIMLPEIDSPNMAAALAGEVRARLGESYIIDGYKIRITVSVGAAVYPADGQTFDDMMKQADIAMYRAKSTGSKTLITALPRETLHEVVKQEPATYDGATRSRGHALFMQNKSGHSQSDHFDGRASPPQPLAKSSYRTNQAKSGNKRWKIH
jgi:diguanylate cyclase (GGDEF)-like protein